MELNSGSRIVIRMVAGQPKQEVVKQHYANKLQEIGDVLEILGKKDFNMLIDENKLNISTLFKEIDICSVCKVAYVDAAIIKLLDENKSREYFSTLEENVRRVRQFNREQDAVYSARHKK
jgi:hypothetical protein